MELLLISRCSGENGHISLLHRCGRDVTFWDGQFVRALTYSRHMTSLKGRLHNKRLGSKLEFTLLTGYRCVDFQSCWCFGPIQN